MLTVVTLRVNRRAVAAALAMILIVTAGMVVARFRHVAATAPFLAGRKVVIDPGHGGIDPGVTAGGCKEEDIALEISLKLKKLFLAGGIGVVMSRTSDEDLCNSEEAEKLGHRKRLDLEGRIEIVKRTKPDLFLSVHANASGSSRWSGAQVFYNMSRPDESKLLAELIQAELVRVTGGTHREALRHRSAYLLKYSPVPAVIIETGFLTNPAERALLVDPAYQERVAWAIYTGAIKYLLTTGTPAGQGP